MLARNRSEEAVAAIVREFREVRPRHEVTVESQTEGQWQIVHYQHTISIRKAIGEGQGLQNGSAGREQLPEAWLQSFETAEAAFEFVGAIVDRDEIELPS